ncbi:MAG: M24 family metallopeptidase [Erysipelotrichaceae bacterium]|nr:M24 family metallopeptidase [Erysipelotrichaceae bacterium]MDD4642947.1 M24 family metallopeptidase [Erysipelotrichaceae bacterium]
MGIYKEKFDIAFEALKNNDIDTWIVAGHESAMNSEPVLATLGDFEFIGFTALVFNADGSTAVVCTPIDADGYQRLKVFDQIIAYPVSFHETLAEYLNDKRPATIALDYSLNNPAADGLSVGVYNVLKKSFASLDHKPKITSAEVIINQVRGIKTADELARIEKACAGAEEIFNEARSFIKAGMNCQDVFKFFQDKTEEKGYEYSWPKSCNPGVFSGYGCPGGHMGAPDFLIKKGDVVNIDFGIIVDGYGCDLQRMYYVLDDDETDAPLEIKNAFYTVRDAIALAAKALKPGITGFEVDKVARDYILSKGYPEWNAALGHQMGRVAHDGGPLLAPERPRYNRPELIHSPLSKGFVFTLEPGVPTKRGRIGLEEDVVIEEDGARFLIPPQQELYLI